MSIHSLLPLTELIPPSPLSLPKDVVKAKRAAGQPVLRIAEGTLRDGVVVKATRAGRRLLCATFMGGRLSTDGRRPSWEDYRCSASLGFRGCPPPPPPLHSIPLLPLLQKTQRERGGGGGEGEREREREKGRDTWRDTHKDRECLCRFRA